MRHWSYEQSYKEHLRQAEYKRQAQARKDHMNVHERLSEIEAEYTRGRDTAFAKIDEASRYHAAVTANDRGAQMRVLEGANIARENLRAELLQARDKQLREVREQFLESAAAIRAALAADRHALRLILSPAIDDATADAMRLAVGRCRSVNDVERLWRDALQAKDAGACAWLEQHAGEVMGGENIATWRARVPAMQIERSGPAGERISQVEASLTEARRAIELHALLPEMLHNCQAVGMKPSDELLTAPGFSANGGFELPPAESI